MNSPTDDCAIDNKPGAAAASPTPEVTGQPAPQVAEQPPDLGGSSASMDDTPDGWGEFDDPNDWGMLLRTLAVTDSSPDSFRDLESMLLKTAAALARLPPLESALRQRQTVELLRRRRIRGASALMKAATAQVRQQEANGGNAQ